VKARHTTAIKTLLTLGFVGVGIAFVWQRKNEFEALDAPSAMAVAAVIGGYVVSVFLRSLYNTFAARRLGTALSVGESFMLSAVVTASNYVLPANPGAAFRAYYMKKVHDFPLTHFAGSTMVSLVITLLMMSLIAMLLLALIYTDIGYFRLDLFLILPAVAVAAGVGLLFRDSTPMPDQGSKSPWSSFRSAYLHLVDDRGLVRLSLLLVGVNFVVASSVWVVALRDFAPELPALEALLLSTSQIVSGMISLTPGAAGFQEVVGLYVGASFQMSTVELFAVLVWVRLVRIITALLLAGPCALILRHRNR
jgi:uncharacterized membrane protein YbhN (UPF0104 family)